MGGCNSDLMMSYRYLALTFPPFPLILATTLVRAQDNCEIQVYGSDLIDPGHTVVGTPQHFTIDGSKTKVDRI